MRRDYPAPAGRDVSAGHPRGRSRPDRRLGGVSNLQRSPHMHTVEVFGEIFLLDQSLTDGQQSFVDINLGRVGKIGKPLSQRYAACRPPKRFAQTHRGTQGIVAPLAARQHRLAEL